MTRVMLYDQAYINLSAREQRKRLRRAHRMGVHAFAVNLHAPVLPSLPSGVRVDDSAPWLQVGSRYEMSEPRKRVRKSVKRLVRTCARLDMRAGLYCFMGPDWGALDHPQFHRLQYRGTPLLPVQIDTYAGTAEAGFSWYFERALTWALDAWESVDGAKSWTKPFVVDGVETALWLPNAPHYSARIASIVPTGMQLYVNRHGDPVHIGTHDEGHFSPGRPMVSTGSGGLEVGDGWGACSTRWPSPVGPRPYAALPAGASSSQVADAYVSIHLRPAQARGRDYLGVLLTESWAAATFLESKRPGGGPWTGHTDITADPWGRVIRQLVRVAERG